MALRERVVKMLIAYPTMNIAIVPMTPACAMMKPKRKNRMMPQILRTHGTKTPEKTPSFDDFVVPRAGLSKVGKAGSGGVCDLSRLCRLLLASGTVDDSCVAPYVPTPPWPFENFDWVLVFARSCACSSKPVELSSDEEIERILMMREIQSKGDV